MMYGCKVCVVVGIALSGVLSFPSALKAALIYDEAVNGDLSGNHLSPTKLPDLTAGENEIHIIINNTELAADQVNKDLDYFTVTLPKNLSLTQLILKDYVLGDDAAFIAIQKGSIFTENPSFPNPSNILGFTEVGTNPADSVVNVGEDLLPLMGLNQNRPDLPNGYPSPNPIGFTAPLASGNYAFWVQQSSFTDPSTQITLNFVTASVPEPSLILASISAGILGTFFKKKTKPKK
ncbi:conserved hypothetical protein [Gloeothece citriformis PCC 7424]|uniref:PEP-CTERM protein-sorting domain-containing protein n=1 Tax=Gloeothece citriformis (strain PCC 7424) TaxID=65393 RepID=B7KGM1_GLOC7|nr:hypothetical protein [Gloeothece citriformis]ACK71948.1 conserved hypothetical protein [Gloeothece citriformis PCC 7424]